MHVPSENQLTSLRDQILNFTLNCQKIFGLSDELMAHQLHLNIRDFNLFKYEKEDINIGRFEEFLKKINVSAVSIFSNSVDYDKIFHEFYGNMDYLQSKYIVGANGKKRTLINILDYIEKTKGKLEKLRILRRFQMSPLQFQNPDELINNNFIVDLLDQLLRDGYSVKEIIEMGENSYEVIKGTDLGRKFHEQRSKKEILEYIFVEAIDSFDKNFNYSLKKLDSSSCVLQVTQNNDVAQAMGKRKIGSVPLSLLKLGVLSTFSRHIGQRDFDVELVKSAHHGSQFCEYSVKF